jgi:hypothetical protein
MSENTWGAIIFFAFLALSLGMGIYIEGVL